MKRLLLTTALFATTLIAAHAQFTQGTKYIATSVTGLNASYSKTAELNFGLNAEGGYYFADGWMLRAALGYNHAKTLDGLAIGAGVRYSFLQNGIFIGAGLEYDFDRFSRTNTLLNTVVNKTITNTPQFDLEGAPLLDENGQQVIITTTYVHTEDFSTKSKSTERVNNIRIPVEIGYTFYLNHYLAIEPAIYSKMSLNHFSEGSEFGLKVGFGFFFDRFHNVHNSQRRIANSGSWDF